LKLLRILSSKIFKNKVWISLKKNPIPERVLEKIKDTDDAQGYVAYCQYKKSLDL